MVNFKPIICIDFDGVIHSYRSGWQGIDIISDPPVADALLWLSALVMSPEITPVIYSSRSKDPKGIKAMQAWLIKYGMPAELVALLEFPTQKPAAYLTIDDRALCFDGTFPSVPQIKNFTPWFLSPTANIKIDDNLFYFKYKHKACGQIAFQTSVPYDQVTATHQIVLADNTHPDAHTQLACYHCNTPINNVDEEIEVMR